MSNTQKINLTKLNSTLLSGRKNGERAHESMAIQFKDAYEIIARDDQLITSSYFLGLIGKELVKLAEQQGSIDEIISKLNLDKLNKKSRDECIRAVRRSISSPRALIG
ncbi:hypothetical protein [Vibrio rarus]|uniref:hypothetical protein n=1 Tax=Vibrio rarus TaxID=413403 RepID=UPI0021C3383E|nr:hypothetical protein [Vibrio rarus]